MNINKKIIIRVIVIILILTPFFYVQGGKFIYKYKVSQYLIEEKGYKKEDIKSIKAEWGKVPPFQVIVYFKDEPHIEYRYLAHNRVHQSTVYQVTENGLEKIDDHVDLNKLNHYDLYKYWQY